MRKSDTGGRPAKWTPDVNEKIIEFFDRPATKLEGEKIVANDFPTLERFAFTIGVNADTIVEWSKDDTKYPGFPAAYLKAKGLQKDILVINGITGRYNANFAIFVAKNATDMRDVSRTEVTGADGKDLNVNPLSPEATVIAREYEEKLRSTLWT